MIWRERARWWERARKMRKIGGVAALVLGASALVMAEPAGRQDAPEADDPFVFTSDAAIVFYSIKPEATEDFEVFWRVIQQRVASSTDVDAQALFETVRMYQPETPGETSIRYVFYIDPVLEGRTYSPTAILFESGLFERAEADELFARFTESLISQAPISTMPINAVP